jgi:hypothetical protein
MKSLQVDANDLFMEQIPSIDHYTRSTLVCREAIAARSVAVFRNSFFARKVGGVAKQGNPDCITLSSKRASLRSDDSRRRFRSKKSGLRRRNSKEAFSSECGVSSRQRRGRASAQQGFVFRASGK